MVTRAPLPARPAASGGAADARADDQDIESLGHQMIRRSLLGSNRQTLAMSTRKVDSSPGRALVSAWSRAVSFGAAQHHDGYLVGINHRFWQGIQACEIERDGHLGHHG